MKLRNKKTGEIRDFIINKDKIQSASAIDCWEYNFLAELNEEWEDYEEPKTFFTIYYDGAISEFKDGDDEQIRDMKEIGNYFDTREEAEKAVERLRAWKRVKDEHDFKFTGWKREGQFRGYFIITAQDWNNSDHKLLDLLFGGEE